MTWIAFSRLAVPRSSNCAGQDRIERRADFMTPADDITALRLVGALGSSPALQRGVGLLVRLDFVHQHRRLDAGSPAPRRGGCAGQHQQPGGDTGNDEQGEEHDHQRVADDLGQLGRMRRRTAIDEAEQEADDRIEQQEGTDELPGAAAHR